MGPRYPNVSEEYRKIHPRDHVDEGTESREKKTHDYDVAEWNGAIDLKKLSLWVFAILAAITPWIFVMMFFVN